MRASANFMEIPTPDIYPGVSKNVFEGHIFNHEDAAGGIPPPSLPWDRLTNGDAALSDKGKISPASQTVSQQHHIMNGDVLSSSQHVDAVATPSSERTRSGRSVQKPTPHNAEKTVKKQASASAKSSARKRTRTKSQVNILCTSCNRGNSPSNNLIVLCDECDTPWHQKCHNPKIGNEVIETVEAEWVCSECRPEQPSAKRRKKTTRSRKPATKRSPQTILGAQTPSHPYGSTEQQQLVLSVAGGTRSAPRVGGGALSEDERRTYLTSLSHAELVELLVDVSKDFPRFPMFPFNLQLVPQESGQSSQGATAPTSSTKTTKASPSNGARAVSYTVGNLATAESLSQSPPRRHITPGRRTRSTTASPSMSSDPTLRAATRAARRHRDCTFDVVDEGNRSTARSRLELPDTPLFSDKDESRQQSKYLFGGGSLGAGPFGGSSFGGSLFGSRQNHHRRPTPFGPSMAFNTQSSSTSLEQSPGNPYPLFEPQPKTVMRPLSPASFSETESENDSEDYRAYADAGEGFNASSDPNDRNIMAEAEDYPTFSHSVRGKK